MPSSDHFNHSGASGFSVTTRHDTAGGILMTSEEIASRIARKWSDLVAPLMRAQSSAVEQLANTLHPGSNPALRSSFPGAHHRPSLPAHLPFSLHGVRYGNDIGAAYSAFAQGVDHGITLTGAINGAVSGAEIGGPIGAAAGLAMNLLGGLFGGHHHTPQTRIQDPALQFSPLSMDYMAYRYRATAGSSTASLLPGYVPPSAAPAIHLYIDGVKTAVQSQINQQISSSAASRASVYYDMARPL